MPLPTEPGKPQRYDYEYKREGTCNLFMFFQPLGGWRHVRTTGSHRIFKSPGEAKVITIAGKPGEDVPAGILKSIRKIADMEEK